MQQTAKSLNATQPALNLQAEQVKRLKEIAKELRVWIIRMLAEAGSGHPGGSLSAIDILTVLYFHTMRHNPQDANWPLRDRFILSKGHGVPALYAVLAKSGYFPMEELKTLRKLNSRLQGHPHRTALPGVETTSGPLGEGISQAIGMALAAKLDKKPHHIYVITSDGEHQEGNTWEAAMFAAKNNLDNLTVVVDRNNIQIDGMTEDVMPLDYLTAKYESFNWFVQEVDGHNIRAFVDAVNHARSVHQKPSVIIAHTIPGFGVDFMENKYEWHGKPPNAEEAKKALHELRTLEGKIKSEHQ